MREMTVDRKLRRLEADERDYAPAIVDSTMRTYNGELPAPMTKAERRASYPAGSAQYPYPSALTREAYYRLEAETEEETT